MIIKWHRPGTFASFFNVLSVWLYTSVVCMFLVGLLEAVVNLALGIISCAKPWIVLPVPYFLHYLTASPIDGRRKFYPLYANIDR